MIHLAIAVIRMHRISAHPLSYVCCSSSVRRAEGPSSGTVLILNSTAVTIRWKGYGLESKACRASCRRVAPVFLSSFPRRQWKRLNVLRAQGQGPNRSPDKWDYANRSVGFKSRWDGPGSTYLSGRCSLVVSAERASYRCYRNTRKGLTRGLHELNAQERRRQICPNSRPQPSAQATRIASAVEA